MRLYHLLFSVLALFAITACEPEESEKKQYPELETLEGTMWYSYDTKQDIYYDIYYNADGKGKMLGYDTSERNEDQLLVERNFTYKYTRATADFDAVVDIWFEDGQRYGGILIPKGNLQVSNKDVYVIQLYELTADGDNILYDENGNIKSTLMMWKE